jgi:hypothetical protein
MQPRRLIDAKIVPGKSLTRFHLAVDNPAFPDNTTELHVAHHDTGDLKEDAQWYNLYEHPTEAQLKLVREALKINEEDWKILEHMLGSFRWVLYRHTSPSEIRVDVDGMKKGEWTTTYF